MGTTDSPRLRTATTTQFLGVVVLAASAVAVAAVVFELAGHPDSARGALVGGGAMIALLVLLRWRASHRAQDAGPAARVGAGVGDERDRAIMTHALATTGYFSFVTLTALCFAVVCGADPVASVAIAMFLQIGAFAVAFAVRARQV